MGAGGPSPFGGKNLVDYIANHWSMTGAGPSLWKVPDPPMHGKDNPHLIQNFSKPSKIIIMSL